MVLVVLISSPREGNVFQSTMTSRGARYFVRLGRTLTLYGNVHGGAAGHCILVQCITAYWLVPVHTSIMLGPWGGGGLENDGAYHVGGKVETLSQEN